MEIALIILISAALAVTLAGGGFWLGYSFMRRQLPTLPLPDIKVEVVNKIEPPARPAVLQDRKPIETQRDSTAEFIGDL